MATTKKNKTTAVALINALQQLTGDTVVVVAGGQLTVDGKVLEPVPVNAEPEGVTV